jgi:alginate O-acetyltransferase complex protein AlgI
MLFSSIIFLFYFLPLTLCGYFLLGFSRRIQNAWIFIASIFFYAWGEPTNVLLMLLSIAANWALGLVVDRVRDDPPRARLAIIATCVFNLGFLFVYKYLDFLIRNINAAAGAELIAPAGIALPIGISFFTFQAMSYVFDVYRQDAAAERNPLNVGLYIAFFPQLIAGPIVRYSDIAEQIRVRSVTWDGFSSGVARFVTGLGKKTLLANSMALVADHVFNISAMSAAETNVPASLAWVGAIAYTLQIYYDFSGYSDMAIGLGRMFGFEFLENFNYPYISLSISDFWRRWHISLSTWFREYVYFPLGGNRVASADTVVRNTFIVWLLTGIWHGADWSFVVWGLWNFTFIIVERVTNFDDAGIPRCLKHIYAMLAVIVGWVFFRAQDMYQALLYMKNMFGMNGNGFYSDTALMFLREYWLFFSLGIFFSTAVAPKISSMMRRRGMGAFGDLASAARPVAYMALFAACVAYLVRGSYNPFIYFNF